MTVNNPRSETRIRGNCWPSTTAPTTTGYPPARATPVIETSYVGIHVCHLCSSAYGCIVVQPLWDSRSLHCVCQHRVQRVS